MGGFRRRLRHGTGVVIAVALLVGGALVAYRAIEAPNSPASVVTSYLHALAASDAPSALALGDVPAGPRAFLTTDVLRAQQRNAAIRNVSVGVVDRTGTRALVHVQYLLDWPGDPRTVSATVSVHRRGREWRLDQVAVASQLNVDEAAQRATVGGAAVPRGTVLMFPGAAPIVFDTPYLQLAPSTAAVAFAPGRSINVDVQASGAARRDATAGVSAALKTCLTGRAGATCPQPSERYVPGSLRGALPSAPSKLAVTVDPGSTGILDVSGNVSVVGTYRRLTFANRPVTGRGRVTVYVHAAAYAVAPLRFVWTRS